MSADCAYPGQGLPAAAGIGKVEAPPLPIMPRCRHCGSANISRDANACWDEVAQAWSLLATYDSQTCERCGADSNNLIIWVPLPPPGSLDAFLWAVIEELEDPSLAGNAEFRLFCRDAHPDQPAPQAAANWLKFPRG